MASVNKVILVGHLGKDPELRHTADGEAVCNITMATSDVWKDKTTGEKKEKTEWHNITFFSGLAEVAGKYLKKGSQIYVEGKLNTRKWKDKNGDDRYTTEIRASELKMLGGKDQGRPENKESAKPAQSQSGGFSDFDDDLPF